MKAYGYKHDDKAVKAFDRQRAQKEIKEEVDNIIENWVDSYYNICEWEDYTDEPRPYLRIDTSINAWWYGSSYKFIRNWVAA